MIKVHFDEKTGAVVQAFCATITGTPDPYIEVGVEEWLAADGKAKSVLNGRLATRPLPADPVQTVKTLEEHYHLPRPVRTALLLAREAGQTVDAELMSRVDEIESLASALRSLPEGDA